MLGASKMKTAPADNSSSITHASASSKPIVTATQAAPTTSATAGSTGTHVAATVKTGGPAGHTLYRSNASGILTQGKLTNIASN